MSFYSDALTEISLDKQRQYELSIWAEIEDKPLQVATSPSRRSSQSQIPPNFKTTLRFETGALVQDGNKQKMAAMITVEETSFKNMQEDTCKPDVLCVIDTSGSMTGDKIKYVKKTLVMLLNFLTGSRLSIIVFDTGCYSLTKFKNVTKQNINNFTDRISQICIAGETDINNALESVDAVLDRRQYADQVTTVFLLSDGQHNGPDFSLGEHFASAKPKSKYTIHTFGYGEDHDAQLLQSIAQHKSGNYYFIDNISRLDECFVDCLATVTTCVCPSFQLDVKFKDCDAFKDFHIISVYSSYLCKTGSDSATLNLVNVYAGYKKNFLIKVEMQSSQPDKLHKSDLQKIGVLTQNYITNNNIKIRQNEAISYLMVPKGQKAIAQIDKEVKKNMARIRASLALEESANMSKNGDYHGAVQVIKNLNGVLSQLSEIAEDPEFTFLVNSVNTMKSMYEKGLSENYKKNNSASSAIQQMHMFKNQTTSPLYRGSLHYSVPKQSINARSLFTMSQTPNK